MGIRKGSQTWIIQEAWPAFLQLESCSSGGFGQAGSAGLLQSTDAWVTEGLRPYISQPPSPPQPTPVSLGLGTKALSIAFIFTLGWGGVWCVCRGTCVGVRGQLLGIMGLVLFSFHHVGPWGPNSAHQAWQQVPLVSEPSLSPAEFLG